MIHYSIDNNFKYFIKILIGEPKTFFKKPSRQGIQWN